MRSAPDLFAFGDARSASTSDSGTRHRELGMTQRYMHLGPAALETAIRLLDQAQPSKLSRHFGDGDEAEGKIDG